MPPLPSAKFGDDVETHGSPFLQEYNLLILRIILPSIGVGLLMLVTVIIVIIRCRLCCPHRGEKQRPPPTADVTSEKPAQPGNEGENEETKKTRSRNATTDSKSALLDTIDEEAEEVEKKNGEKAPIYTQDFQV